MESLKTLLEKLIDSQVDFVLIGGFAGVVHGSSIVTQDLDICTSLTSTSIELLRTALKDYHPVHRMNPNFMPSFLEVPSREAQMSNLYLKTDLGILDVLSQVPPMGDFSSIKSRAVTIEIFGRKCRVISIEDLISVKETMSRPKDLQSLEELKQLLQLKSPK